MHNLLIAALFIVIVLSPCVAALWSRADNAWKRLPVKNRRRGNQMEEEMEDPLTAGESNRRAVLLKCARTSQLRHLHLYEGGLADETTLRSLRQPAVPQ